MFEVVEVGKTSQKSEPMHLARMSLLLAVSDDAQWYRRLIYCILSKPANCALAVAALSMLTPLA